MKIKYGKIKIPHLGYTINVKKFEPCTEVENALAYVKHDSPNSCSLYINNCPYGDLAHELVHVLQFICLDRNINFTLEQEHMGYIMHYLYGQITGEEYDI